MTIAFTGGGTGGHFYPIIAIAEAIQTEVRARRLIEPKLFFIAPAPFDENALFENGIVFIRIPAGKIRRYATFKNITGLFITIYGIISAIFTLFRIYPDVVVSKGGYGSVPTTIAARLLGIPVVIHESDAKPGRANLLAAKWAKKIAISFGDSAKYFPKKVQGKIARTGIPVRRVLTRAEPNGAKQYLGLETNIPTVLVLGGSLGSVRINETITGTLPEIVSFANVIHQTGRGKLTETEGVANVILYKNPHKDRYHVFDYLSETAMQRAAGAADLIISRAGAGAIAEIALWKKPAILIPIPESVSHDQRTNAYTFAGTGGAVVIEEANLTPHIMASEIKRIAGNPELSKTMGEKVASFGDTDAAKVLAQGILSIVLSHEL